MGICLITYRKYPIMGTYNSLILFTLFLITHQGLSKEIEFAFGSKSTPNPKECYSYWDDKEGSEDRDPNYGVVLDLKLSCEMREVSLEESMSSESVDLCVYANEDYSRIFVSGFTESYYDFKVDADNNELFSLMRRGFDDLTWVNHFIEVNKQELNGHAQSSVIGIDPFVTGVLIRNKVEYALTNCELY